MAKIFYQLTKFRDPALHVIARANQILEEYAEKGYDLTLRQLYYQFVARGLIDNNQREYKNLGSIVNDARLCGLIDWDHIVDRTRNVRKNAHWSSPSDIVKTCAQQFQIDKWAGQRSRIEVWIEKDALIGVVERVCRKLDIPYFSCRGYVSQSEIHEAALDRYKPWMAEGQDVVILHLGDHDPSGIDMSRDIADRLLMFQAHVDLRRIALNMDQVRRYNPPPNPAKITDSRATKYIEEHGDESWELDALSPEVIEDLITSEVDDIIDQETFDVALASEQEMRDRLALVSKHWDHVAEHVTTLPIEQPIEIEIPARRKPAAKKTKPKPKKRK